MSNGGKWFAHPALPENAPKNRETSTSTGIMLSQVKSSLPQALYSERYPKRKSQQESREFPYSDHDNKHSLNDSISVFAQGVGRRKDSDDCRQTKSHFCLCHDGSTLTESNITIYKMDFMEKQSDVSATSKRRFPKNYKQRSVEAALAQTGNPFMWFGRYDPGAPETLQVLGETNHSVPSIPKGTL
ncbi:testis-expressed protein 36 [Xyrichtys novacula]|uniref:Testis-expressed protein 36 n=1 Tax=Xyrichtys novacula TaxID=13765 RepID=A0AAV1G1N3_XYRNO|nr:testis-expressed protein 36 [Xyrichtys novacula]